MTPHTDTDWLDELLIPNDNCLKIPGEHCGSCLADFEDSTYTDMSCCSHVKWRDEAKTAIANKLAQSKKALFLELISECEPIFGAAGGVAINRQSLIDKVEAL